MGKKRKIISKPQKFGRKFTNHPLGKATPKPEEIVEPKPEIKKPEVKPEIKKSEPAPVKEIKSELKKTKVKKKEPRKRKAKTPPFVKN